MYGNSKLMDDGEVALSEVAPSLSEVAPSLSEVAPSLSEVAPSQIILSFQVCSYLYR